MTIDVHAFDSNPFVAAVHAAQASGIHFFSMAETDCSEAMLRRLYDLNTAIGLDIPGINRCLL